ncbi:MAG: NIPSNAP family protein [Litorilinea sp.]
MTFHELREYRVLPGKREAFVKLMEETVIPFQASKGMVVVAAFTAEEEDDLYVWIRRFNSEEEKTALYAAVYESDFWKTEILPLIPQHLDRTRTVVRRLNPTPNSILR